MPITISTINLCLGLKNKKLLVKRLMDDNKIDVLCMQETEVGNDLNIDQLSISGYSLELEKNSIKSRVGLYISKSLKYVRRIDLEGQDSNIVVIDLDGVVKSRVINVYRSFAPQNGNSERRNFQYQLALIEKAIHVENSREWGDSVVHAVAWLHYVYY